MNMWVHADLYEHANTTEGQFLTWQINYGVKLQQTCYYGLPVLLISFYFYCGGYNIQINNMWIPSNTTHTLALFVYPFFQSFRVFYQYPYFLSFFFLLVKV